MAFPFGGHPTLEMFVQWAHGHGCTSTNTVRHRNSDGQPYATLTITGPAGGRVILVNPDMAERLGPSQVTYMQRRIGVKSPFSAAPDAGADGSADGG